MYVPEYILSVYSTCYYIILSSQSNCCLIFEWAGASQPRPATSPWLVQGVTNRPYWPAVVFRSARRAPPSKSANDGGAWWTLSLISNSVILILNVDSFPLKCSLIAVLVELFTHCCLLTQCSCRQFIRTTDWMACSRISSTAVHNKITMIWI